MTQLRIIILLFTIIILNACQTSNKDFYKSTELKNGFPDILKPLEKDLPFKITSHSILDSNNDSIDIYLGELNQGKQKGTWIALASNKQIKQFSSITINNNSKNEKENDIDLEFNNSKNRISLRIKHFDTINNNITYSWINRNTLTDSLNVQTINKPLAKGKTLPYIEIMDANGEKFDLEQFKEKILVINWWATWCSPCIKEIPGLNKLVDKYSDQDVKFISITDDSIEKVSNFLNKTEFKYDITFISENSRILFGSSYPKNIIIDRSNNITFYKEGGNEHIWQSIDMHLAKINTKKTIANTGYTK